MNARAATAACAVVSILALTPVSGIARATRSGGHLYVAAHYGSSGGVYRYPLTNGIPAPKPDLFYPDLTGPLAIGPDGDLYAVIPLPSGVQNEVKVFAEGTNRAERSLILPAGMGFESEASIAVDAKGYLFVSHYDTCCGNVPIKDESSIGSLLAYGPGAKGNDPYLFAISGSYEGLAVDAQGALYGASFHREVHVFQHPETSLRISRKFSSDAMAPPEGIALDGVGLLHVLDISRMEYVTSYAAAASGETNPVGAFPLHVRSADYTGIAIGHGILYVPLSAIGAVQLYPATAGGGPVLFTLKTPFPATDAVVGP